MRGVVVVDGVVEGWVGPCICSEGVHEHAWCAEVVCVNADALLYRMFVFVVSWFSVRVCHVRGSGCIMV